MYKNPVLDLAGLDQGDPSILRYQGFYYLYHTGQKQIPVYRSANLVDWTYLGVALEASSVEGHWAGIDLWAPEVIYAAGKFYMYVAGALKVNDDQGNDNVRRIGVAVSESPEGPFILNAQPLTDEWSIDAHPFKDSDGTWYMYYNVRNELTRGPEGVIGCGNVVDKMVDFTTLEGKPSFVCKPEDAWEGSLERDWYWNEGSFTIKRLGKYYQMYSGGCYRQSTYHLAYAVAPVARGAGGLADRSYVKWPNGVSQPILQSNEEVWGPGHHVVTKGPNGIDNYVVYHGHVGDDPTRTTYIDPLYWYGSHMFIDGPTAHPRSGPALPRLAQPDLEVIGKTILSKTNCTDYLWEFWLPKGCEILVYLEYNDDDNYLKLDFKTESIEVIRKKNHQENKSTIPNNHYCGSGWRQLRVLRNAGRFDLYLDEQFVWSGVFTLAGGNVGFESEKRQLVSGIIFTKFFADSFSSVPREKDSSGLVTHTLKDTLEPWQRVQGEYTLLNEGIIGQQQHNQLERDFECENFQLELDIQQALGKLELVFNTYSLAIDFDSVNKRVIVGGERVDYPELSNVKWDHLWIRKYTDLVEIIINGSHLAKMVTPMGLILQKIQVATDKSGIINNISMVEIFE